jgi:hypothetical protein
MDDQALTRCWTGKASATLLYKELCKLVVYFIAQLDQQRAKGIVFRLQLNDVIVTFWARLPFRHRAPSLDLPYPQEGNPAHGASHVLPSPSLQHVRFIQRTDGQSFHRAAEIFADFE